MERGKRRVTRALEQGMAWIVILVEVWDAHKASVTAVMEPGGRTLANALAVGGRDTPPKNATHAGAVVILNASRVEGVDR